MIALAVSQSTYLRSDTRVIAATPSYARMNLVGLLLFIADLFTSRPGQKEVTVLLHADLRERLGLPAEPETMKTTQRAVVAEALGQVRAQGWKCGDGLYPFLSFHSRPGSPDVHLGVLPWIAADAGTYPLVAAGDPRSSLGLLAQWQQLTGHAYRGMPGLLAMTIHREHWRDKGNTEPRWHAPDSGVPYTCDQPYTAQSWRTPRVTPHDLMNLPRWELDANKAYLAADISGLYARYALRHQTKPRFDPKQAGYWLIKIQPWNDHRLPHPAGPGSVVGQWQWRATPRVQLLTQLSEEGVYGGVEIQESWTSKGYPVLKPGAEVLSSIIHTPGLAAPLKRAASMAFKNFHGLLTTDGGSIHRPDWYTTRQSLASVVGWKRARTTVVTHKMRLLYVKTDAWYFERDGDVPTLHDPQPTFGAFKIGDRLGQYTIKSIEKGHRL